MACNDESFSSFNGESELTLDVSANETYYIAIEGWYSAPTNATLNISIDETQDCSGTPLDQDGDGFDPSNDCDDSNPNINPNATEVPADGVDSNCDGIEECYLDIDGDGYGSDVDQDGDGIIETIPSLDLQCDGFLEADDTDDCDDLDATVYPGAAEVSGDGVDQDCDGAD